jgi:hypothetical protein
MICIKQFLLVLLGTAITSYTFAQGLTKNGQITTTGSTYVNNNGTVGATTGVNKNGQIVAATSLATVSTTAISAITAGTATSGGNVTSDGGAAVTAKGVCWGTSTNPTIALGTLTTDGTGTGSFTSSITGLGPGTTYYVRAYATNSIGTAYGTQQSLVTSTVAIGDSFGGGKVAYILALGDAGYIAGSQHGLIAATADLATKIVFETAATAVTTSTAIGSGKANTIALVATFGTSGTYAAHSCQLFSVTSGGVTYADWYLPSVDELNQLWINRALIGGFSPSNFYPYWSSNQDTSNTGSAASQYFSDGTKSISGAGSPNYVRPIRSF